MAERYIWVQELRQLFKDDEMLSCDRPFDVYQWASNIIDECSEARVISVPFAIGQEVWKANGERGVVDSFYIGKKGVQRIFVRFDSGERFNLTMKGIGKDVLLTQPSETLSDAL